MRNQHATAAIGRIAFGSVIEARLNESSGKTEWSMGWVVPEADAQDIFDSIERAIEEMRQRNPRFPKDNSKLHMPFSQSMKKDENGERVPEDGVLLFKFKRNASRTLKTGEQQPNTPPHLYDSTGRLVDPKTIGRVGGGSTGRVVYETYVYDMPAAKGVQLQLVGFQVDQLRKEEAMVLPTIEGGWVAEQSEADEIAELLANA